MPQISTDDKIAILLELLGDDVVEEVLSHMRPERSAEIRSRLEATKDAPISRRKREEALAEFDRFYRFVRRVSGPNLRIAAETGRAKNASGDPDSIWQAFEPSEDPIADVAKLTANQLAGVLSQEHPRTAALLLSYLPGEHAARVLELLSEEHRRLVFVALSGDLQMPAGIVHQVVAAVVKQAVTLDPDPVEQPDRIQKAVSVLRAVDRPQRGPLLEAVESNDQETASQLFENLYQFEDILALESRTVQRLLAEVDSNTLATALAGADEELVDKIMSSLSKRAGEALREEIEFQENISQDVVQQMRKEVAGVLARLDQQDG